MFEDSLLESGGRNSKLQRRGPWATLLSFLIQAALIGVLVLIPLIYTDALPKQQLMGYLVAPPPPPPPPPPPAAVQIVKVVKVQSELDNGQLKAPTAIPKKIQMLKEDEAPPSSGVGVVGGIGVPGGSAGGMLGGVLNSIASAAPSAAPKIATPKRITVSQGVTQGMVVRRIQPTYPPLARTARVSGAVVLQAVIAKDGSILNLHAVSGNPLLIPNALDAVKQWRYKPYLLNGEPVEVDTQITVNFTLSGS
jgi:protein TonB